MGYDSNLLLVLSTIDDVMLPRAIADVHPGFTFLQLLSTHISLVTWYYLAYCRYILVQYGTCKVKYLLGRAQESNSILKPTNLWPWYSTFTPIYPQYLLHSYLYLNSCCNHQPQQTLLFSLSYCKCGGESDDLLKLRCMVFRIAEDSAKTF